MSIPRTHCAHRSSFLPGIAATSPVAFLLLFLLVTAVSITPASADVFLSSPRSTFKTFLGQMNLYAEDPDSEKGRDALRTAVRCLDIANLPVSIRETTGARLAISLKNFMDRFEAVKLTGLPDTFGDIRFIWRKPADGLEISLVRDSVGDWRFSQSTLKVLPQLLRLVRGNEVVKGVENTLSPDTFAQWVRQSVPEMLRHSTIYFENWQWIALILLVLVGLALERIVIKLFSFWLMRMVKHSAARERYRLDRRLVRPIGVLGMSAMWAMVVRALELPLEAELILYFATQVMIAASGVWAVYNIVDIIANYFQVIADRTETKFDDLFVPMIRRALKIIVITFGLLFVADNFDIDITSLLAGLGIGGIALALAAKDTVENLFGSLTVLFDKPFEIGDWIAIGEYEGTVEEVGFRSTRIRTFYNSQISVPNANLTRTAVDNFGRRQYRRTSVKIGVQYNTPPEKIEAFCEGIRELIRRHPFTRKDLYHVYFNEFAASSLNIMLYAFHEAPDWATELRERHRLFLDVVRLAHRLEIEFAFPTQTVHIASTPPAEGWPTPTAQQPLVISDAPGYGVRQAEDVLRESLDASSTDAFVDFSNPESMRTAPDTKHSPTS